MGEMYKSITGVQAVQVLYKDAAGSLNELVDGKLDYGTHDPVFALAQQREGRLDAVETRERDVHENQIRAFFTRLLDGAFSVAGDDQAIAILEQLDEQVPIELDVLNDQDGLQCIRHRSVRAA